MYGVSPSSDDIPRKTLDSTKPVAPAMLAAEQGKDSNFVANQDRGILIMWNGPADPAGANIEGYEIQRKVNDGDFELLGEWSNRTTHFTDTSQPAADEIRMYQVRARNKLGWSPWSGSITSPLADKPNEAPTTVGTIADRTMTVGDAASTMNVSGYFSDADGDTLTYSAMSSDTAVATATVAGSMLTVTPVAVGSATITVTATDPDRAYAMQTFMVTVEAAAADVTLTAPSGVNDQ